MPVYPTPMTRHAAEHAQADSEPLRREQMMRLEDETVTGPITFLHPTQAHFSPTRLSYVPPDPEIIASDNFPRNETTRPPKVRYKFTTRNNRKGRHGIVIIQPSQDDGGVSSIPTPTSRPSAVLGGIWRMLTYFPYWDVSWLVGVMFTLGSAIWVVNGFFTFLPFILPGTEFPGQVLYGAGVTAFIGTVIFEVGSVLLMLEALNENQAGSFGWAVEQLYNGEPLKSQQGAIVTEVAPTNAASPQHYQNSASIVSKLPALSSTGTSTNGFNRRSDRKRSWVWWPSKQDLNNKYLRDIGFWACFVQLIAATVFWISGFTALPGILNNMSQPVMDALFWTPQVIGGLGFVTSGMLFMIETQKYVWWPALDVLGWHIGFWNWIGGVGFLLCPCFGYSTAHWAQYQAALSTFWGSWAFLIGSTIQWYESLQKQPVEMIKFHET